MKSVVDVQSALLTVLDQKIEFGTIVVSLEKAIGRVLAEDIYSDRPIPPFDRVCMDGIAIDYMSYKSGQRYFEREKLLSAGDALYTLQDPEKCVEIMTGAVLPNQTNTVIRYEDLQEDALGFKVLTDILPDKNIHYRGSDFNDSKVLLPKNTLLKAVDINILATVGKSEVRIKKMPTVALISTGDELVDIHTIPQVHQIRRSNVYMLASRLEQFGISATHFHLNDERSIIENKISILLEQYDVLILSGGVSKGKLDYIPSVLDHLGFRKLFHGVRQRPGKPMWFGRKDNCMVFAFPGNPVSTIACLHKYFIPWLYKCIDLEAPVKMKVKLDQDVQFKPDFHYYAQAKIKFAEDGICYASIRHGNGSGDIVNPSTVDGFVEFPRGKEIFLAGEIYDFIPFHPIFP